MSNRIRFAALIAALTTLAIAPAAQASPLGNPADWTYLPGEPKWDPCAPITWSTPIDGSNLERALSRGIRKLGRFTGYTFVRIPEGGQITATVLPSNDPRLVSAAAFTDIHADWGSDGLAWTSSAQIGIDVAYMVDLRSTPIDEYKVYTLPIMLHELGHAMGLGHAASQDQAMMPGPSVKQYGAGDRTGLTAIHAASCAPPPAALRGGGDIHQTVE